MTNYIEVLRERHRALDEQVAELTERGLPTEQLKLASLKKQRLQLKDQISEYEKSLVTARSA